MRVEEGPHGYEPGLSFQLCPINSKAWAILRALGLFGVYGVRSASLKCTFVFLRRAQASHR